MLFAGGPEGWYPPEVGGGNWGIPTPADGGNGGIPTPADGGIGGIPTPDDGGIGGMPVVEWVTGGIPLLTGLDEGGGGYEGYLGRDDWLTGY